VKECAKHAHLDTKIAYHVLKAYHIDTKLLGQLERYNVAEILLRLNSGFRTISILSLCHFGVQHLIEVMSICRYSSIYEFNFKSVIYIYSTVNG
jgi:hypothetical protein